MSTLFTFPEDYRLQLRDWAPKYPIDLRTLPLNCIFAAFVCTPTDAIVSLVVEYAMLFSERCPKINGDNACWAIIDPNAERGVRRFDMLEFRHKPDHLRMHMANCPNDWPKGRLLAQAAVFGVKDSRRHHSTPVAESANEKNVAFQPHADILADTLGKEDRDRDGMDNLFATGHA